LISRGDGRNDGQSNGGVMPPMTGCPKNVDGRYGNVWDVTKNGQETGRPGQEMYRFGQANRYLERWFVI
jgi:hypothetical protein